MTYEIENKFPVACLDAAAEQLRGRGAELRELIEQVDLYFGHPVRDFAETDEALRIRRIGEVNLVTYKGPKVHAETKTRREIELPLARGREKAEQYGELLAALGFHRVAEVRKHHRSGKLAWEEWEVEVVLDHVAGLGDFLELEIVAEQERVPAAQSAILRLAAELQLG